MEAGWISNIFLQILNMSVTAGIAVCVILCVRLILRKAPKIFSYALWSVVLFRLLCPVAIPSSFSALHLWNAPVTESGSVNFIASSAPQRRPLQEMENERPIAGNAASTGGIHDTLRSSPEESDASSREASFVPYISLLWLSGTFAMAGYGAVSTLRLKRRLTGAIHLKDNIYLTDYIDTPFTMGVLSPKIYLPHGLSQKETPFILLHEQTHIRRGDAAIKLLAFFALSVHWFNPLVWIAFFASEKDMEMSCDEAVMKKMSKDIRADYSNSLLYLASGKKFVRKSPLAFGESSAKSRVKNIMRYKKPAAFTVCAASILVIFFLLVLCTNPGSGKESESLATKSTESQNTMTAEQALENDLLEKAAIRWANAFCSRNGESIAVMSTEPAKDTLKRAGLLKETENSFTFGTPGPWPQGDSDYQILSAANNAAEILYYARTSEPHVCVWKETLSFLRQEDGSIRINEEHLEYYDEIRSFAEYISAYPNGISGTPMDYRKDDAAEILNQSALLSSSFLYQTLSEPESAAVYLLNLAEDAVTIGHLQNQEDGSILATIYFPENTTATIKMIPLFAKDSLGGIWIPQDYEEEASPEEPLPESFPVYTYSPKHHIWMGQFDKEFDKEFDEDFYDLYTEKIIYSTTADVTHDGILDRLDLVVADNREAPHSQAEDILDGIGLGYVKVHPGTADGKFQEEPAFISPQLAGSHVSNGQICLVKKDGMDYLMASNLYEIQGSAEYYYTVFYLEPDHMTAICVDEQRVEFSVSGEENESNLSRKERIPDFIRHLEQWTNDSILFLSCDAYSTPSVYVSEKENVYTASDYYSGVWERK